MTSNVINQKDYTRFQDTFQLVLPLNLEGLIPEDDSIRLLSHVFEGLDYTELYAAYSSKGIKPAAVISILGGSLLGHRHRTILLLTTSAIFM